MNHQSVVSETRGKSRFKIALALFAFGLLIIFCLTDVRISTIVRGTELYPMQRADLPALKVNAVFGSDSTLDGCFHVFLDLGSNVGIQVRKLFEPEMFPDAPLVNVFKKYFGSPDENGRFQNSVCAVGFEPNPHHSERLKKLEDAYYRCGKRVHFFTETAVADRYGQAALISNMNLKKLEWGAHIEMSSSNHSQDAVQVRMARISDFIIHKLATRKIPPLAPGADSDIVPRVIVKMDIEGSELEVFLDLLMTGSLQHIDLMLTEWHTYLSPPRKQLAKELQVVATKLSSIIHSLCSQHKFQLTNQDDETYSFSNLPLPSC